jgi:hypothetical protein
LPAGPGAVAPAGAVCRFCGYDIGGLATGGTCPECGSAVMRSLKGNLLEYADPVYLRSLQLGVRILFLAIITINVVETLMGLYAGLYGALNGFGQSGAPFSAVAATVQLELPSATSASFLITQVILRSFGSGVILLGWWLLSARDPGATGSDPDQPIRRFLRTTLIVNAVMTTVWLVVALYPGMVNSFVTAATSMNKGQSGKQSPSAAFALLTTPFFIANSLHAMIDWVVRIVLRIASLTFMRALARRIPDESLANLAGVMRWLVFVIYVVLACISELLVTVIYAVMLDRFQTAISRAIVKSKAHQTPASSAA